MHLKEDLDYKRRKQMYDKFHAWMQRTESKLTESKLIKWGFCQNYWGWAHAIEGGVAAKILFYLMLFFLAPGVITALWTLPLIFARIFALMAIYFGARAWENYEEKMEAPTDEGKIKIYGSVERWKFDGKGDIWLAVITAFLVLI